MAIDVAKSGWVIASRARGFTLVLVRQVMRFLALSAVAFILALVAGGRAQDAVSADVSGSEFVVAILAFGFTPGIMREVGRISALLAHIGASAKTAVVCTEWAGATNALGAGLHVVAIRAVVLALSAWIEILLALALRAGLVGVADIAISTAWLADNTNFTNSTRILSRRTRVLASREGREV